MSSANNEPKQWLTTRNILIASIAAAATYYLWVEHHTHFIHFLPYAIFILCPFVHIIMHRGHAHGVHGSARGNGAEVSQSTQSLPDDEIASRQAREERNK